MSRLDYSWNEEQLGDVRNSSEVEIGKTKPPKLEKIVLRITKRLRHGRVVRLTDGMGEGGVGGLEYGEQIFYAWLKRKCYRSVW